MNTAIVIPARYASTRFPGKPLAIIEGKSLLERTWRIASAVKGIDAVVIATDDQRIADHATTFGAEVQLTSAHWRNGSERILEALQLLKLSPDIVINLQGDAVLTPPFVITKLLDAFSQKSNRDYVLATPCVQYTKEQCLKMYEKSETSTAHGTKVVFDQQGRALYFSRAIIPFPHSSKAVSQSQLESLPVFRHIGLYAFRYTALQEYVDLKPTPLELIEGLEQLRALEHGWQIKMVQVDYQGRSHWSVDNPEDVAIVERIIKEEGELV